MARRARGRAAAGAVLSRGVHAAGGHRDIAYQNKAVIYDLLFKASSETMLTIAADPKHLGARIGFMSVLHTWGSAMTHHPHVHMIVPGGGISRDGSKWVACRPRFLFPVEVLSHCSAGCFWRSLPPLIEPESCSSSAITSHSPQGKAFTAFLAPLRNIEWVRLLQAAIRWAQASVALSRALYPSRRDLQPPTDCGRRDRRHLQVQGLPDRRASPLQDDDARRARVHPPLPHPRAARGLPPHPPLRAVRQRLPRRQHRPSARAAQCAECRRQIMQPVPKPPSHRPSRIPAHAAAVA